AHGVDLRRQLLMTVLHLREVALAVVRRSEGVLALDAMAPPRLFEELFPAHPSFRLAKLALVDLAHDLRQPLLGGVRFRIHRRDLTHAIAVPLGDDRQLRLTPIALDARLARLQIGSLPFLAELRASLEDLRTPPPSLLELNAEVLLEQSEPIDVTPERVH